MSINSQIIGSFIIAAVVVMTCVLGVRLWSLANKKQTSGDTSRSTIDALRLEVAELTSKLKHSESECLHYLECLEGKFITYNTSWQLSDYTPPDELFLVRKNDLIQLRDISLMTGERLAKQKFESNQLELPFHTKQSFDRDYADYVNYARDIAITYKASPQLRTVLSRLTHEFRKHLDLRRKGKSEPFRFIV